MSNLKALTLHAHGTGPNPYKIALALEILKLPYEVVLWDFGDGPSGVKSAKFLAICPNGRVPALEDPNTGITSWESGACMNYLLRTYDKKNILGPRAGDAQAQVDFDKWIFFLVSSLGPMMGQVNWFRHYHPEKNDDAQKRYDAQAYRCFEVLESELQRTKGKWILAGDGGPSAVDLHFYPWVSIYEFSGLSADKYPAVKKWLGEFKALGEVKTAYEKIPNGRKA